MSKPKEWWFDATSSIYGDEYFETFISGKNPKELNEHDDYMGLTNCECVHVIEKSAYDALAAENEKLKDDTVRLMRDMGIHVSDIEKLCSANAELVEALKFYANEENYERHFKGRGQSMSGDIFDIYSEPAASSSRAKQALEKHGGGK